MRSKAGRNLQLSRFEGMDKASILCTSRLDAGFPAFLGSGGEGAHSTEIEAGSMSAAMGSGGAGLSLWINNWFARPLTSPVENILVYKKMDYNVHVQAYPANTKHLYNICTMLDRRRRRWADVVQCYTNVLFAGHD